MLWYKTSAIRSAINFSIEFFLTVCPSVQLSVCKLFTISSSVEPHLTITPPHPWVTLLKVWYFQIYHCYMHFTACIDICLTNYIIQIKIFRNGYFLLHFLKSGLCNNFPTVSYSYIWYTLCALIIKFAIQIVFDAWLLSFGFNRKFTFLYFNYNPKVLKISYWLLLKGLGHNFRWKF